MGPQRVSQGLSGVCGPSSAVIEWNHLGLVCRVRKEPA